MSRTYISYRLATVVDNDHGNVIDRTETTVSGARSSLLKKHVSLTYRRPRSIQYLKDPGRGDSPIVVACSSMKYS